MKAPRRPLRKKDANHNEMVAILWRLCTFVEDTHTLGQGFPDVLVAFRGRWIPIEIKVSAKEKLTPVEQEWWKKAGMEPNVVWDDDSILRVLGIH